MTQELNTHQTKKRKIMEHNLSSTDDLEININTNMEYNVLDNKKYKSIMEKFKNIAKSIPISAISPSNVDYDITTDNKKKEVGEENDYDDDSDNYVNKIVAKGLEPIPQPDIEENSKKSSNLLNNIQPEWITKPFYYNNNYTTLFTSDEFKLNPKMIKNLNQLGFYEAFPVQRAVIPLILNNHNDLSPGRKSDILVNASTGSGKTLSYAIPIIESLSNRIVPRTRCVILLPTKPLIKQVRDVFESLSKGYNLRILTLRSDRPFKNEQNLITSFLTVPDIIISTPGRLVDHINSTKGFSLNDVEFLVIDEADRLLNQSFQNWVKVVTASLNNSNINNNNNINEYNGYLGDNTYFKQLQFNRHFQNLVFSATLTRDPGKLADLCIQDPKIIVISDSIQDDNNGNDNKIKSNKDEDDPSSFILPPTLSEYYLQVPQMGDKPLVLAKLLTYITSTTIKNKSYNVGGGGLIFVNSNEAGARLARLLTLTFENAIQLNKNNDYKNYSISIGLCTGQMEKSARNRTLRELKDGKLNFVVATDLVSRGLDIPSIKHVINYDLPHSAREYVHRVGRTARAGTEGLAWSLVVGRGEKKYLTFLVSSLSRSSQSNAISQASHEILNTGHDGNDILRISYENSIEKLKDEVNMKSNI